MNLAGNYISGTGVEQDYSKAFMWFSKAAEQGDVHAWYNLGCLYLNGYGVEADLGKAKTYLEAAKENGHPMADDVLQEYFR